MATVPMANNEVWSSDLVARTLIDAGIDAVSFTAGSSYRGLLESIQVLPDGRRPELIPCLHEEHAVALAHGYAKVTGRPMAVLLHSNVGLMHGSMAVYNAFVDRQPVLILGAGGPFDSAARRSWIDWIHTATDQAALVRNFVKWDAQPVSPLAGVEAVKRALAQATRAPYGPVYVCFDQPSLEQRVDPASVKPPSHNYGNSADPAPSPEAVTSLVDRLTTAEHPVFVMGRTGGGEVEWNQRIALAECFGAKVITDMRAGASFPTGHKLHIGSKLLRGTDPPVLAALRDADVVVGFDCVDLGGLLREAGAPRGSRLVATVSVDDSLHNGWSQDHMEFVDADMRLAGTVNNAVAMMIECGGVERGGIPNVVPVERQPGPSDTPGLERIGAALSRAANGREICLARLPIGWQSSWQAFGSPLDYLGFDGGGGLGSGPGMTIGAAIGLRSIRSSRLCVSVIGDGDYLMGVNALWSAAFAGVGLLMIVANNRAYGNEMLHTAHIAQLRGRTNPLASLGHVLTEPALDLAALATAQGFSAFTAGTQDDLDGSLASALSAAATGHPVVLDVQLPQSHP